MQKYDAIIIGSGLGGLTCGATLSRYGKRVLVLEQHNLIGGCATCFPRKDTLIDVGLHEIDFGTPDTDMKYHIFDQLGLWERIKLIPLPTAWTIFEDGKKCTIPHNNAAEVLKTMFPHETKGINKYFKMIKFQAKHANRFPFDMGFLRFFFAPLTTIPILIYNAITNRTVGTTLDKLFQDERLKNILNINLNYYHHDSRKLIWSYHAIPQHGYYNQGMYVYGGSQALSNGIASIITENGGAVRSKADVVEILLDKNQAIGVKYLDKTSKEHILVYADTIIANCDPKIAYQQLLPQNRDYSKDLNLTQNFEITTSLFSIYMVFDKNLSQLYPDMDYSNFITKVTNPQTQHNSSSFENLPFVFVNYSKIDSGLSHRNDRYCGVITAYASYEDWDKLDKEAYKAKKTQVKKIFENRLEKIFPEVMKHCIHSELSTPKTIEHYIRTRKGTPYGYDQNKEGFMGRERFKSKSVKNLYFASAFGYPGGGFTGAMLGGYRTAKKILDPYAWPRKLTLAVLFGIAVTGIIRTLNHI